MRNAKCFDVMDKDITPAIYTLLFSDVLVELTGNDTWYRVGNRINWLTEETLNKSKDYYEPKWQERLSRGWQNCYHDTAAMKAYVESNPTILDAVEEMKEYLIHHGVDVSTEEVFVNIWW